MSNETSFILFFLVLAAASGLFTRRYLKEEGKEGYIVLILNLAALGTGYLAYKLRFLPLWQVMLGALLGWIAGAGLHFLLQKVK